MIRSKINSNKTFFNRKFLVLLILLVIPISHIIFNNILWIKFNYILKGKPVYSGLIDHKGESKVELYCVYGDIFMPSKYSTNVDFDLVPVTCIFDPIKLSQNNINWEYNHLLYSALLNTYHDPKVFRMAVKELIANMSNNGVLINYFLKTPCSR